MGGASPDTPERRAAVPGPRPDNPRPRPRRKIPLPSPVGRIPQEYKIP